MHVCEYLSDPSLLAKVIPGNDGVYLKTSSQRGFLVTRHDTVERDFLHRATAVTLAPYPGPGYGAMVTCEICDAA